MAIALAWWLLRAPAMRIIMITCGLALALAACGSGESTVDAECRATLRHLVHLRSPASESRERRLDDIDENEIDACRKWSDDYRRCLAAARYDHEVDACRYAR